MLLPRALVRLKIRSAKGAVYLFPEPYLLRRPLLLLIVLGAGGLAALSFWRLPAKDSAEGWTRVVGRSVLLIGRVAGNPTGRTDGDSFRLQVRWVQPSGARAFRSRERIEVFRKNPAAPFAWGDEISVWGPLMPVEGGRGPGGISARLFVPEGKSALLHRASPIHPVRWAVAARDRFHAALKKHLPEPSNQLLCGVLLGDRPPGLSSFAEDFRRSGTFHLLVASGSNVGFAIGAWWVFARWGLWWPRRWAIAATPFIAFFYAWMAGGDPPVLRAAVMASVGSVGALLGRWDRLEHPLILSAGLLLLWDPAYLFQAGFQMSYAATLAIAAVWGRDRDATEEPRPSFFLGHRGWGRWGKWAAELFVTSVAAQAALAPLMLYYFGRLSWVGIGANMVAVPLSGVCLVLGTGLTLLDGVWPAAASVWAIPTRWGADALAGWARLCAKVPGAQWEYALNGEQAIALAVGVTLGFVVLYFEKRKAAVLSALCVATLGVVWGLATPQSRHDLDLFWRGGRTPFIRVKTGTKTTVFKKGEPSPVDGTRWVEGATRWEIFRPAGGDGYALRLDSRGTSVFLNFGLTARQQDEWLRGSPRSVDLLSWMGGNGGPPKKELLALLNPRWIVYSGTRLPISVRRSGIAAYRPPRAGLSWCSGDVSPGFYPSD